MVKMSEKKEWNDVRIDPKVQRRHWMLTVQQAHLGLNGDNTVDDFVDRMEDAWRRVEADPRVNYAAGQLERGEETGRLHAQVYVEFSTSLRNSQVRKLIDGMAEPRRGTRTQCRDYCRKAKGRVLALPDLGEWKPERPKYITSFGPKAEALRMLVEEGMSPEQIAREAPDVYFQFHAAIRATWEALRPQ